jgi:hypothetical protein
MANTYATFDPANKNSKITLSSGNLVATKDGTAGNANAYSTIAPTTGKWYWELTLTSVTDGTFGISNLLEGLSGWMAGVWSGTIRGGGFLISSTVWYNANNARSTLTATTGDVLGFAYDADVGTMSFYKNNSLVQTLAVGTSYGQAQVWAKFTPMYAAFCLSQASSVVTANFGASALTYTPPSGYNAGLYTVATNASFLMFM